MGQVDAALVRHRKATASVPEEARYHLALVSLLYVQQRYAEARQAIEVARRDIPKLQRYKDPLFTLEMISHQVALRMGDASEVIQSLETADSIGGDSHPEVAYELGKAYADASPPSHERALRLLRSFIKRQCMGAKRHTFEHECQDAERRVANTTP
jgi:tetratricopeptide (TPR) repeat protein